MTHGGRAGWLALATLVLGGPGLAQTATPRGSLIQRYAGTFETDQLLAEPRIMRELAGLLGSEEQHLRLNLFVTGSIDLLGGMLVVTGNAAHQGGEEEAVVCIGEPFALHAAILAGGKIQVYSRAETYESLPICIKDWITQANSGHRDRWERPANVRLVRPR